MKKQFEKIVGTIFPNSCVLCGRAISPFSLLCEECHKALFQGPIPLVEKTKWCEVYFYGRYESLLRKAILAYKNEGHWRLGKILARMLVETMKRYDRSFDLLTWVPSSFRALEERGFDTMGTIAKVVAKATNVKYVSLIESRASSTKRGLTKEERMASVRGAFALRSEPRGIVALIDDVYTTGATINECSKLLLKAGAERVIAYCIAKA